MLCAVHHEPRVLDLFRCVVLCGSMWAVGCVVYRRAKTDTVRRNCFQHVAAVASSTSLGACALRSMYVVTRKKSEWKKKTSAGCHTLFQLALGLRGRLLWLDVGFRVCDTDATVSRPDG